MIRSLVPSLALVAAATALTGADADGVRPELRFGGFIDTIGAVGADSARDVGASPAVEHDPYARFQFVGGLSTGVRFTDEVDGRVEVWLVPNSDDAGNDSRIRLRDAWVGMHSGDLEAKAGIMIRPFGWISPHQDQLYRVRESTIGYTNGQPINSLTPIFGNDALGVSVGWRPQDKPVSITAMVVNGFFSPTDVPNTYNVNSERERRDLGYGLDVGIHPSTTLDAHLQAAYDPHAEVFDVFGLHEGAGTPNAGTGSFAIANPALSAQQGGDALLLDANATVKPVSALTLGGEIARFHVGDINSQATGQINGTGYTRWQGLAMANWAFAQASFPISVTGMVQHIQARWDQPTGNQNGRATEFTAALLTQPFARVRGLHLDAELTYATVHSDQETGAHDIELAGRALLTF